MGKFLRHVQTVSAG